MSAQESYFSILGVSPDASDQEIGEAYRRKKAAYQSDPDRLRVVEEAYRQLANPINRRRYREKWAAGQVPPPAAPDSQGTSPENRPAARPASRPLGQASARETAKRQKTEFIDNEDPTPTPQNATKRPSRPSGQALLRQAAKRQKTEFIDDEGPSPALQNAARPSSRPPAQSPPRPPGKRPATEIVGEEEPTLVKISPLQETPKSGPGRRPETEIILDGPHIQVRYRGEVSTYPLQEGVNLIGRPSKNNPSPAIPLPDPEHYVSREHASIRVEGGQLTIIDEKSDNGTFLNQVRLEKKKTYPLADGDLIVIEGRQLLVQLPETKK